MTSIGALVWIEDERRVDAFMTMYAHPGIEAIINMSTAFTLLMYESVLTGADFLTDTLVAEPAYVPHPKSGVRDDDDWDDMLNFTDEYVLPAGSQPNRWLNGELAALAGLVTENEIGISTGDARGLTVEFPLASTGEQIQTRLAHHPVFGGSFKDDPISTTFTMPTALGQLLTEPHPAFGNGLLSLLRFPIDAGDEAGAVANQLNLAEYRGMQGFPSLGAWTSDQGGVAYATFAPNYYHRSWTALHFVLWAAARTRWAFGAFAKDA